jgi:hypothetical protein
MPAFRRPHRRIALPALTVLLAAFVLAACTGPGSVRTVRGGMSDPGPFVRDHLQYAGREGPVLVEVPVGAMGLTGQQLAPRVADIISGTVFGMTTQFTVDRAAVQEPNWRIIFLFNNALNLRADEVCAGETRQNTERPSMNTLAVFCHRDRMYASVSGYAQNFGGVDDPAFRAYARQLVDELFPRNSDEMLRLGGWDD